MTTRREGLDGPGRERRFQHVDAALLRAAAWSLADAPERWPDPADTQGCRQWLDEVWSRSGIACAIRQASPSLADRVGAIRRGSEVGDRQIRRAAVATVGYLLRATGRPTPFGVFAGVAPVPVGQEATVRWGDGHRAVATVDTAWLSNVIDRLEGCSDLLERLNAVFNDLAVRRGGRIEVPRGPSRVTIRHTSAVQAIREATAAPVPLRLVAEQLGRSRVASLR